MAIERTKGRVGVFTYQEFVRGGAGDIEAVLREVADRQQLEPRLEEYKRLANEILADDEASEPCKFNACSMLRGIELIKEYLASGNAEMAVLRACDVGEQAKEAIVNKHEKGIMSQSTAGKASHAAAAAATAFVVHLAKNAWEEEEVPKAEMLNWLHEMQIENRMTPFSRRVLWGKIKHLAPHAFSKRGRPPKK